MQVIFIHLGFMDNLMNVGSEGEGVVFGHLTTLLDHPFDHINKSSQVTSILV
jgi:hypothetical protein